MIVKKAVIAGLIIASLLAAGCSDPQVIEEETHFFYTLGIQPQDLPLQVTENLFPDPDYGTMKRRIGLAGQDLAAYDFSLVRAAVLAECSFDTKTLWPNEDYLPESFTPSDWLNTAKDPGLGVRYLHSQGYLGTGFTAAVLGGPLDTEHPELPDDMVLHSVSEFSPSEKEMAYQGMVTVSLLSGKTCGIAPDAKLHYYEVEQSEDVFVRYGEILESIVALNETLPAGERIRLVLIADGISPESAGWPAWQEQLDQAKTAGIDVLYANNAVEKGFFWGGCPPYKNRDQAANYEPAGVLQGGAVEENSVLVPGEYRTTALQTGDDVYMYWADGGFNWALPYLGGLTLLAWQTAPDLTLDELMDRMLETADDTEFAWRVLNPVRFLFTLENDF